MNKLLIIICLVFICGCQTNKLAMDDLNRIDGLHNDVAVNYNELSRILLRFAEHETRAKNYANAKLEIYQSANSGQIAIDDIEKILGQLQLAEENDGVIRNNTRDDVQFLAIQHERAKTLGTTMRMYINGQRGIIEMLTDRMEEAKKNSKPTTQPSTKPAE